MASQSVVIKGRNTDGGAESAVIIEEYMCLLGATDLEQMAVSMGRYFAVGHYDAALVNTASIDILVRTGSAGIMRTMMLGGLLASGGSALLEVFQAPTITADGNALAVLQVNQLSPNINNTLTFEAPTVSATGTMIFRLFVPGGSGGNSVGATSSPFQRLLTLPDTDYLIRGTNLSGQAVNMSLNLNWVEVPA